MAGQKFEYDESGSTFFYFLTCFLGLILVPCTFYFWPAGEVEGKERMISEIEVLTWSVKHRFFCVLNIHLPYFPYKFDRFSVYFNWI